jgi:hypothetical protein
MGSSTIFYFCTACFPGTTRFEVRWASIFWRACSPLLGRQHSLKIMAILHAGVALDQHGVLLVRLSDSASLATASFCDVARILDESCQSDAFCSSV